MIHIVTVCRVYSCKYIFDFFFYFIAFILLKSFLSKETVVITVTWFDSVYNIIKQFRLYNRWNIFEFHFK